MRQWGSRYAIRAGRNLPAKEFRYLRTVIVTAAVYRGFGSELSPFPLTFRHRAGVRPYTSSCDLAEPCVFGKQSLPPLRCDPPQLSPQGLHHDGHTFFRSYGVNLQSSLTRVLSSALVYSTRLPESVYGTVTCVTRYEDFLGSMGSVTLCPFRDSSSPLSVWNSLPDLPSRPAYGLEPGHSAPGWPTLLRPPFADNATPVVQEY